MSFLRTHCAIPGAGMEHADGWCQHAIPGADVASADGWCKNYDKETKLCKIYEVSLSATLRYQMQSTALSVQTVPLLDFTFARRCSVLKSAMLQPGSAFFLSC